MKKNLLIFLAIVIFMLTATMFAFADTYFPSTDGLYEFTLELQPDSQYVLFAIKGEYDVTNYIEAFAEVTDEDIIYFEQKAADEQGRVSFGPFAPNGYFDATLIVIGSTLDEPVIAGYLSSDGALNNARIDISGVESKYTVEGKNGADIVVDIETKVFDSFGYESFINNDVTFSLIDADGITIDEETGRLVISRNAKEQIFGVAATAGETTNVKYTQIVRALPRICEIKLFDNANLIEPIKEVEIAGAMGNYPSVTFYAKSFDQFGDETADNYSYFFDGESAANTVKPSSAGEFTFTAASEKSGILGSVTIKTLEYEENSLALYNLIKTCEDEIGLLGVEKFVCDENGKSVFAPYTWTTSSKKTAFQTAVENAKTALQGYDGTNDAQLSGAVTTLRTAYNTYTSSFKTGVRKDVTSIYFKSETYLFPVATTLRDISAVTEPRLSATTDKITYTSSDPSIVQVTEGGDIKAVGNGTVTITATTRGGLEATCRVTSYRKVTQILFDKAKYTAEYGKENVVVDAEIRPNAQASFYGDTIEWSLENPSLAELVVQKTATGEAATIIPKASGKTKIVVRAVNSGVENTVELNVVLPDWEKASSPVASDEGNVAINTQINLTTETADAVIYYTLDGTTPSSTNGRIYTAPIAIVKDVTLKAVAVKNGMFDSDVATYEYTALDTSATVSSAVAKAGESVAIDVSLYDFVDVETATVEIVYDSQTLTFVNAVFDDGAQITTSEETQPGKYVMNVSMTGSQSLDGKAAMLLFDISSSAQNGPCDVVISKVEAVDVDGEPRMVRTQNGEIFIRDYLLGDANDDGKIGLEDVLIIKQYLSGNANAMRNVLFVAADVNGDGIVDKNDSSLIAQYCVGLIDSFN